MIKLNDLTLVETGMSDTFLGKQAPAGYGGDNERLRSAVSAAVCLPFVSLQNAAQLPRGEVPRKGDPVFFRILRPSSKKKPAP